MADSTEGRAESRERFLDTLKTRLDELKPPSEYWTLVAVLDTFTEEDSDEDSDEESEERSRGPVAEQEDQSQEYMVEVGKGSPGFGCNDDDCLSFMGKLGPFSRRNADVVANLFCGERLWPGDCEQMLYAFPEAVRVEASEESE